MIQIKSLGQRLLKGSFARAVASAAFGTLLSQLLNFLASPILSRLYAPAQFGVFSLFTSVLSTLLVIVAWRYDTAIPMPASNLEASQVWAFSLKATLVSSFLAFCATLLLTYTHIIQIELNSFAISIILAMSLIFGGFFQSFNFWSVRIQNYMLTSWGKLGQAVSMLFTQILLGFFVMGSVGLIFGYAMGLLGGLLILAFLLHSKNQLPQKSTGLEVVKTYQVYAINSSFASLFNSLGLYAPIWGFNFLFGKEMVGWLSQAQRLVQIPTLLLGLSIGQVYMGRVARLIADTPEQTKDFFIKTVRILFWLSLLFPIFTLISYLIIPWLFGEVWRTTGTYLLVMTPYLMLEFVVAPISPTANLLGHSRVQSYADAFRLILLGITFFVIYALHLDHLEAIAAFSLTMGLCYLGYLGLYWRLVK